MSVSFPFLYEKYILNETNIIKFIYKNTDNYGLCEFKSEFNNIYLLNYNNIYYIIFNAPENKFFYFYNCDENFSYFINENNEPFQLQTIPVYKFIYPLFNSAFKSEIINFLKINFNINVIQCSINKVELDLTDVQERITQLNMFLFLNCQHKYKINLDYAYRMNNIAIYGDSSIVEEANNYYICLNLYDKCVSSIEFNITLMSDLLCMYITSKTIIGYEGNKFNKFLRAVCMIIAPYFLVTHLYSAAYNPISALLMSKMFNDNEYDEHFKNYLDDIKKTDKELTLEILNEYIEDEDEEEDTYIDIYSPVNELNMNTSLDIFMDLSRTFPCEYNSFYEKSLNPNHDLFY